MNTRIVHDNSVGIRAIVIDFLNVEIGLYVNDETKSIFISVRFREYKISE